MRIPLVTLLLAAALPAQDAFTNFETPVVKGLTVVANGGNTWVVACNPDDHAVSVINASTEALVQRVKVGLGPCSLYYDEPTQRVYSANHLGDSVSVLEVTTSTTAPLRLLTTQWVGDEPTDLGIRRPGGTGPAELWVLLSSSSRIARFDPATLLPVNNFWGSHDVPVFNSFVGTVLMKYPYRLIIHNDEAYILNLRGGTNTTAVSSASLEAVRWDFGATIAPVEQKLGTSHMGMAISSNGTMYVVGNNARNDVKGEPLLRDLDNGFVESRFWAHTPGSATSQDRNLNKFATASTSVSMPTDVALLENGNNIERAFIASFSTDRVVEVVRGAASNVVWGTQTARQITPRNTYSMAGPRSLVTTMVGGVQKLFVLCRLDAAIRVYDVTTPGGTGTATTTIPINDPVPIRLRDGQRLLYDARLSDNGNGVGTVSCASCHIDGKTDGLGWELDPANPTGPGDPINQELIDGIDGPASITYALDRGVMVTQTLQGLRTHTARTWQPGDYHTLLSTRPFYWRGKRATFLSFGPAFDALLGKPLAGNPAAVDALMAEYREYAFTIMFPPNPEQPIDRVHSGDSPSAPGGATGARLGLSQFFEQPLDPGTGPNGVLAGALTRGRSCVQCHAAPTGTNGMLSEFRTSIGIPGESPIKSAQLRGLRQRENIHVAYGNMNPFGAWVAPGVGAFTHNHGLFHDGSLTNINDLLSIQFNPQAIANINDLIQFVREWDTGAGPMIGRSMSFDSAIIAVWTSQLGSSAAAFSAAAGVVNIAIAEVEKANCDLVVDYEIGTTTASLYYDVQRGGFVDPNDPPGTGTVWSVNGTNPIIPAAFGPGDRLVLQCAPIGSGRRIASPNGQLVVHTNTAPSAIQSVVMAVPDPWKDVPALTNNLSNFNWNPPAGASSAPFPKHVARLRDFQAALRTAGMLPASAPAIEYHEAPRRFRVAGTGIQPGAKLTLFLPTSWNGTVPATFDGATTFELYPVRDGGILYWETSAVVQPKVLYAMANGWFAAPGVAQTYGSNPLGGSSPAGPLDPAVFNQTLMFVSNEHPTQFPEPSTLRIGPIVLQ